MTSSGDLRPALTSGLTPAVDAATVREAFPEWRIAEGPECWFAIRGGLFFEYGPRSLIRSYLSAPDLPQLMLKLGLQRYLDHLTADELAEVWTFASLPGDPIPAPTNTDTDQTDLARVLRTAGN